MAGYNEMMRRIEPEKIICFNTPFPEMQGNIIYVDYERSSWRYMNYERSFQKEDLDAFKIGSSSSGNRDTIEPYLIGKGGGSAYGGGWKPSPNKPDDQRFLGEPGEIKTTYKNGYRVDTKIGSDGRAKLERHYTDHRQASVYKGYKRDEIEMRGDRAEMSDFPLYLNTVAGGLDCRNQAIGGFSFVVKIYALPVVEIIGQFLYLLGRYGFDAQIGYCF